MSHRDANSLQQLFHRVVADYTRAVDTGQRPDRERLLDDHSELADPLRAYFAFLDKLSADLAVEATQPPSESGFAPTMAPESSSRADSEHGSDPEVGSTVRYFGDYELIEEIARGGMGVVYKARQVSLNRPVALKMILSGQLAGEAEIERFRAEAEAAANLDHPGIVPIYEIGQHRGQHYFSMGFVEGKSLAARMAEGPLRGREAAELIERIARAVAFAHDKGVVHRDLKPGNVLLDVEGKPRVTDFGLAKQLTGDSNLTATGQILGTPSYMAPEQAQGGEVDERADVYALGAILYAVLTARPPHQAASPVDTIRSVIEREPAPPRQLDRSIPRDLETICLKALAKEPGRRYTTAADFADDLQRYLNNEPIVARRVGRVEKGWLWCRRNPKTMAAISVALSGALLVGVTAWKWRSQTRVDGLVEALLAADVEEVHNIVEDMHFYRRRITPQLRELLASEPKSPAERRQQLHARVALVAVGDESEVEPLLEELLRPTLSDARYAGIIITALEEYHDRIVPDLWQVLHNPEAPGTERFRAGLALAGYVTESEHWTEEDDRFLAEHLLSSDPEFQPEHRDYLRPRHKQLLPHLVTQFTDGESAQRVAAAKGISDYAVDQPELIAELIVEATTDQFGILYPLLENANDNMRQRWRDLARQQPAADLPSLDRVTLGQQRADAAITLLLQGERESIFDVFRVTDDPASLTHFIHRCRDRGVTPAELLECLDHADVVRQSLTGEGRKVEDLVVFGLLLALGEFQLDEMPSDRQESLVELVHQWHATDPSSGIHGATGWLLRHWGREDLSRSVDQTPVAYAPGREWFTMEVKVVSRELLVELDESIYFTFIVFSPGEYLIGSPEDEPHHQSDEARRSVRLTRPLAISDREVTWEQWEFFEGTDRRDRYQRQFSREVDLQDPVFGVNWFEWAHYCRWLTARAGRAESEQCYGDPEALPRDAEGNPTDWPLDLDGRGFRMLTEAEWEVVCRSGTRSAFSFGSDFALLEHYGWYEDNAGGWIHAVGRKRPNVRGLFDLHGNVTEWCHDWSSQSVDSAVDPTGPSEGLFRVFRGGSWLLRNDLCRSAYRHRYEPVARLSDMGFRLALRPTSQASDEELAVDP